MKIERIEPHIRRRGWLFILLSNGENLVIPETEGIFLHSGKELTGKEVEALRRAGERVGAMEKGAQLLGFRPHSKQELKRKLISRGTDEAAADAAADRLEELGAINDAEYAKTVVRHYSGKGYGLHKLKDELYRRGVDRSLWEEAFLSAQEPEEGIVRFLNGKLKGRYPTQEERGKLSQALSRRGFRWEEINRGIRLYEETAQRPDTE